MPHVLYLPGSWYVAVSPHGAVMLPGDAPQGLVGHVWEALEAGQGLGGVLESLTAAYGTGLAGLPPFAVAIVTGAEARIAVRGSLAVEIIEAGSRPGDQGDAAAFTVSGEGITTWSERVVAAAARVTLLSAPDAVADESTATWMPVVSGVVLAQAARVDLGAVRAPEPASSPAAEPAMTPLTAAAAAMTPLPAAAPPPAADPAPTPTPPVVTAPDPVLSPEEIEPVEDTRTDIPEEAYDHLWGETVVKSVESAAVRELDDDEDEGAEAEVKAKPVDEDGENNENDRPEFAPASTPPDTPTAVTPTAPADWTAPPATGLIDRVPGFSTAIGAPSPVAAPSFAEPEPEPHLEARDHDHDGLTITVSELDALRRLAGTDDDDDAHAAGPAASGPETPASHGTLRVSTGDVATLDRTVIIGRRPRANRVDADRMPTLLTVPSPEQDISRNHLEVRVEGRHVLAVDLATTNGSVLHREGTPPARLTPNEAVLVLEGDVIDIGDGVTLTFEGLA